MINNEKLKEVEYIDFRIDFYEEWIKRFRGDIKKLKEKKKKLFSL